MGTTGESATLNHKEHCQTISFVVKKVAKRIPVIAGTGANSTSEAIDLTRFAADAGVDGCLSVTPYYNKPTQEGLFLHFKTIAKSVPIPLIPYNVPGRTAKNMEPETSLRLARDCESIVAIKEAGNNPEQYKILLKNKPEDFLVISGDDDLVCDVVLQGGSGVISVIGQALPELFSTMIHKGLEGNQLTSKALEKKAMPLINLIFEENNPAGIKAVLKQLGLCDDTVRLPLVTATDALKSKIKEALAQL